MKRPLVVLATMLSLVSSAAFAGGGTWTNATVKSVEVYTVEGWTAGACGLLVVVFNEPATGGASCGSTAPNMAVINISNSAGGAAASLLLRALTLSAKVTVHGTGTCGIDHAVETLASVLTTQWSVQLRSRGRGTRRRILIDPSASVSMLLRSYGQPIKLF